MPNHTKPTNEELAAELKSTIAQAEADETKPETAVEPDEPTPEVEPVKEDAPAVEEETAEEEKAEVTAPPEVDYKKKFSESSREAQILYSKNKQVNAAIDAAKDLPPPTDAELTAEYPEWDVMSDTERKLAKNNFVANRRFDLIVKASQEGKDIQAFNEKVDAFVNDPKTLIANPELEGKQEDFKIFAALPENRTATLSTLVLAFEGYQAKNAKPKNKGQMMEKGSAGPTVKSTNNDGKLTVAQGAALMQSNYPEFKRLLREGKIAME